MTDPGELTDIGTTGITNIGLSYSPSTVNEQFGQVTGVGSVTVADGSLRYAYSVNLEISQLYTEWARPEGFEYSINATVLPYLKGYGQLPDLWAAMTIDGQLLSEVQDVVEEVYSVSYDKLKSDFDNLLFEWAGVETVPPGGRGNYGDAKEVGFLEQLYGTSLAGPTVNLAATNYFHNIFDQISGELLVRFMAVSGLTQAMDAESADTDLPFQTFLPSGLLFSSIYFDPVDDTLTFSPGRMAGLLDDMWSGNATGIADLIKYSKIILSLDIEYDPTNPSAFTSDLLSSLSPLNVAASCILDVIIHNRSVRLIAGSDSDDALQGSPQTDVITGGKGDDTLAGGSGNDTYVYARDDGNDVITEQAVGGTQDQLVLDGINPGDVTLVRDGGDVTLVVAAGNGAGAGSIRLVQELDDYFDRGVEQIRFADGIVWTQAILRTMVLQHSSTSGNDVITGFNTDDVITGGKGDDTLAGGSGNDTYVYARGDGNDVITEQAVGGTQDQLVLDGINPGDVTLVRDGGDVTLVVAAGNGAGAGSIRLVQELDDYFDRGVEQIRFADGIVWTQAILRTMVLQHSSTSGNDVITGFNTDDVITGGKGDDTLAGGSGNDTTSTPAATATTSSPSRPSVEPRTSSSSTGSTRAT